MNLARMLKKIAPERTQEVHGATISRADMLHALEMLSALSTEERKKLVGLDPERADIILAGVIILDSVLAVLAAQSMLVSTRGLRHGLLYKILGILG